ncbi:DEAD/DEAH box helicase family protein [Sphingobium algorifonticola]|uniref:Helicase n=1 Tax=Sphingobium algorifonticola TaxID=2008318 RepID=A0A437J3J5_9SPHN|nr:DEAD/DEAH box helicase family protein [Sphingobium algorifonticola]RVT38957.1 helicase [Sphingobium algorifonticola]
MKGKTSKELGAIDVELKEALCDGLVNAIVARVTGADERGRNLLGGSPRRGIFAGQLLPRFDVTGQDDETTDIRVAAVGVDLMVVADVTAPIRVAPRFSVYLRVIPSWTDLAAGGGELDFDFKLRANTQQQIDDAIRTERAPAFQAAGVDRPDWKGMDETKRAKVRATRAQILAEVRRKAYAAHGIKLLSGDAELDPDARDDGDQADTNPNTPDNIKSPVPPIARLVREGRELPLNLVDPAPIPGKWTRLDLDLPVLEFALDAADDVLASTIDAYNRSLGDAIGAQLEAWVVGSGASTAWRDVTVQPGDTLTEEKWKLAMAGLATRPVDRNRVLPDLSRVIVKVERQADFLDSSALSMRVMLDNQSAELTPPDSRGRCNTVFDAGLIIELPNDAHRPLRLDRVEPSYRFREHLHYPAIGLNCGVETTNGGSILTLRTTCAPRFAQPRIIARKIDLPYQFAVLKDPDFDAARLLALPSAYVKWIDEQEIRLKDTVTADLDPADAAIEVARLRKDIASQRAEARYIERGVELLIASKKAADVLAAGDGDRRSLELKAAPWRAWTMTNEAFALRDAFDDKRGWRLFQMAFVLAHVPVFASRMDEWREAHDSLLDEDGVSLLYFPTGGGKSEAFYGTLLFAMFLDRLRGKDRGITAMIRYPLRLLTLQQAQRLLKLVVRAEMVRKKHAVGSWPFEMGFWVGSQNTPNHYNAFKAEIPLSTDNDYPDDRDLNGETGDDEQRDRARRYVDAREAYDKIPECPVCGKSTGLRRDETDGHYGRRAVILCFNDACDWNRAHGRRHPLPFLLTDDAVYARAPSIVLGTVDKLAMLGQNTSTISKVLGMFGLARRIDAHGNLDNPRSEADLKRDPATERCSNVFPAYANGQRIFHDPFPSLIIQDEAHLLEESLGTFSGLFDTLLDTTLEDIADMAGDNLAVARRWTGDGWGAPRMPKIIAATATISAPERQLETLYQRIPLRFPYPGPDLYHSFFAEPAEAPEENADRVSLAKTLPFAQAPEATAPWMRLYISLMTNDATHTVTTVGVLAAFHSIITTLWDGMLDDTMRTETIAYVRAAISPGREGDWHRAALDRAVKQGRVADILALIDLHRIALAYVTNKKGGDQVIDALSAAVDKEHRRIGRAHAAFDSRLISGGIDMKEIQGVMEAADRSFAGTEYPDITETVRNIVATSAISHGVDVDRFNSMFFAGLPSDIAEYIQASSRVGRTHVGFVMLLPTPQNRRDRYVVETHDIFHRFLERMIAPPAVERWAENAIRRTMASYVQAWAMLREARDFFAMDDARKFEVAHMDQVSRLSAMEQRDHLGFNKQLVAFMLRASGFAGKGATHLGSPHYEEFYRGLVDKQVENFARDISARNTISSLRDYWTDIPVFKPPMTSLRDVDEAGYIVAAMRDPLAKGRTADVDRRDLAKVMKAIRTQRGTASELDADGGSNG